MVGKSNTRRMKKEPVGRGEEECVIFVINKINKIKLSLKKNLNNKDQLLNNIQFLFLVFFIFLTERGNSTEGNITLSLLDVILRIMREGSGTCGGGVVRRSCDGSIVVGRNSMVVVTVVIHIRRFLVVGVVVVMLVLMTRSRNLEGSRSRSNILMRVVAIETSVTNFRGRGVHMVEVAVEQVGASDLNVTSLHDGFTSGGIGGNRNRGISVFTVETIDAGNTAGELSALFRLVFEMHGGVVI